MLGGLFPSSMIGRKPSFASASSVDETSAYMSLGYIVCIHSKFRDDQVAVVSFQESTEFCGQGFVSNPASSVNSFLLSSADT